MKTQEREKAFRAGIRNQASSENGAISCGPTTPEEKNEGKKRVSGNARRHGLSADAVDLGNERKEDLTIVIKQHRKHFNPNNALPINPLPINPLEEALIADLAAGVWSLHRLRPISTHLLNPEMHGKLEPNAGLRPPAVDRPASSFTSSAHTPGLKLALQQQPLYRVSRRPLRSLPQARQEQE
jgi:hypothetical protein